MLPDPSPAAYATELSLMTDEEVFEAMLKLEQESEEAGAGYLTEDVTHRIDLTEEEIGRRYPGQMLSPYRDWKKKRVLP